MTENQFDVVTLPESTQTPRLSDPSAGRAYLVQIGRAGNRISTPLSSPLLILGSDSSCGLCIKDPTVNARHARIESRGDVWTIRDLHSTQGVFVNDTRVNDAPLADLDRIRLGEAVLLFCIGEEGKNSMTSKNENWNLQLERLPAVSSTDFPVLMIGPSGSGKEVIAKAIHQASRRRAGPYVTINCSAMSESLIESELFGHVRGSFTGATHDRKGAFETARGGTLFLDEIGDLPLSLQPKLLRAIENKEIRPVGSDRLIETDVRILAATHKDLNSMVAKGKFREDLYWRLNVCMIKPPALQNRMEDFTEFVYYFCKQMRVRLSHGAIEQLRTHDWPGNIRELKNVIARAAAYFPGHHIQADEIETLLERRTSLPSAALGAASVDTLERMDSVNRPTNAGGSVMREIEREMIIRRLVANRGNQRQTAIDLGMPKSTLHDRLKTYSIDLDEIKQLA